MIHNARIFKIFESEDKDKFPVKTKFMIIEEDTDSKPGGYIYLYRDGKLLDRNFIPSSEPRKLTITDIKHDSVKLTWEKQEQGDHIVTEYEIRYKYPQNGQSAEISTSVDKREHLPVT